MLVPFLRPPNADLNMTLAMALIAVGAVQVAGIRAHGLGGRIKHMADPPFLFPIEVIGELSRVVSLSARLFGNVFAGEVLLGVMFALGAALKIALLPMVFPVIFLFLEVLFGTIQALVFSLADLDLHHPGRAHMDTTMSTKKLTKSRRRISRQCSRRWATRPTHPSGSPDGDQPLRTNGGRTAGET